MHTYSREFTTTSLNWALRTTAAVCLAALVLVGATLVIGRLLPKQVQVAYESTSLTTPQQRHIYLMDMQRTLPARLTGTTDNVLSMNWSPDGTQVVYVTAQGSERPKVFILDVLHRQLNLLPHAAYPIGSTVSWSPDGSHIALMVAENSRPKMAVLNIASGDTHILDVNVNLYAVPSWAPDSRSLIFLAHEYLSDQNDQPVLYAVPIDCHSRVEGCSTAGVRLLPTFFVYAYAWSPDGKQLVFNGAFHSQAGVYIAGLTCDDAVYSCLGEPKLLQTEASHTQPVWSPQGTLIAYRESPAHIRVIDMQTETSHQLVTTAGTKNELVWSKDGQEIIYEGNVQVTADLLAINLITGAERQLTNTVTEDRRPKVRPD